MTTQNSATEDLVEVGKVRDSHGLKGELFIVPHGDLSWLKSTPTLWIEYKKPEKEKHKLILKQVTIQSARPHKTGAIVRTEEITDRTEADTYKGGLVKVPKDKTISKTGETIFLSEISGFVAIDEKLGELGPVQSFSSNGAQDLIEVFYQNQTRQIPMVKEFLRKIDWAGKKIFLQLPEGLFDQ